MFDFAVPVQTACRISARGAGGVGALLGVPAPPVRSAGAPRLPGMGIFREILLNLAKI